MSLFEHLASDTMRINYMRLGGKDGRDYTLAPDYSYAECKLAKQRKNALKAGDFVVLLPAVVVYPAKKCKIMVVPNQVLSTIGTVSYQAILEPGDGNKLGVSLRVERDFNLKNLPYLVRLYLIYN